MALDASLGRANVAIRATLDQLDKDLGEARSRTEGAVSKIAKSAEKNFQTLGKVSLGGIGVGIGAATAAIGGLAAVTRSTLPLAADFQSQLTDLKIAAGESGMGFDELHDAALAVGGDTRLLGVSATGAADAMTGLYKAGLSTTEIFGDVNAYMEEGAELGGALRGAIDLAAATTLDMVQASDLGATILATFGGELETAEERAEFINVALDNMVKAADASVAEVDGLAQALKNIGPTAASFGFSIEETNNALAILSTRGIQGAEAGTALKSMLTNIMRPTKKTKEVLNELNVSLYDEQGVMKSLPEIIEAFQGALFGAQEVTTTVGGRTAEQNQLLKEAQKRYEQLTARIRKHENGLVTMSDGGLEKANAELANAQQIIAELSGIQGQAVTSTRTLTEAQRNEYIQTLAGTYGMKAMNTLMSEGIEGWNAMAEATGNAAGIQEQAAAKAQTFAGQMEALEGTIETAKIKIGEALIPAATSLISTFGDLVENVGPSVTGFFTNTLGPALERSAIFLEEFIGWLVAGKSPVEALKSALIDVGFDGLAASVGNIVARVQEFWAMIEPTVSKVMIWIKNNVELKDVLITLGAAIGSVVLPVLASIVSAVAPVIAVFVAVTAIVAALRRAWESNFLGIRTAIQGVIEFVGNFIAQLQQTEGIWEALSMAFEDTRFEHLQKGFNTVRDAIERVSSIVSKFTGTLREGYSPLKALYDTLTALGFEELGLKVIGVTTRLRLGFDDFKETVMAVVGAIRDTLFPPLSNLPGPIEGISQKLGPLREAFYSIKKTLTDELGPTLDELRRLWEALKPVLKIVAIAVGVTLAAAIGVLIGVISGLAQGVAAAFPHIMDVIQGVIRTITGIFEVFAGVVQWLAGLVTGNTELQQQAWERLKSGVVDIVSGLFSAIKGIFQGAFSLIEGFVLGFIEGIIGFFQNLYERLVGGSIIPNMWDAIIEVFERAWDSIKIIIGDLIDNIIDFFRDTDWKQIGTDVVQGIIDGITRMAGKFADVIVELFKKAYRAVLNWLGIDSPSKLFYDVGMSIAEGLIQGIRDSTKDVEDAARAMVEGLLDAASTTVGLAGTAAGFYERRFVDPIEDSLEELEKSISSTYETLGETEYGRAIRDLGLERLGNIYQDLYSARAEAGIPEERLRAMREEVRLAMQMAQSQEKRNQLTEKYEEAQERLLRLERARQDLQFLKQQVELLDMIGEYGLDAGQILQGLELGIDANLAGVIDAMVRATQAIVAQTEEELGIASASRVFARIGQHMMEGLAAGISRTSWLPASAMDRGMREGTRTVNNLTLTVNTQARTSDVLSDIQTARALLGA